MSESRISSILTFVTGSEFKVADFRNIPKDPKTHVSFYSINLGPLTIYVDDIDVKEFKEKMQKILDSMENMKDGTVVDCGKKAKQHE